jgi:hypothetical protein
LTKLAKYSAKTPKRSKSWHGLLRYTIHFFRRWPGY